MKECGCQVKMVPNKYGNPIEDVHPEIVYCPTHANAERMLEAMKELMKDYRRMLKDEWSADPTRESDAGYFKAKDVIAATGGKDGMK